MRIKFTNTIHLIVKIILENLFAINFKSFRQLKQLHLFKGFLEIIHTHTKKKTFYNPIPFFLEHVEQLNESQPQACIFDFIF